MRIAWLTDIHVNFLDREQRREFLLAVRDQADAVVISGDIAESHDVEDQLREMARVWQRPIYFVLGNHDFYRGSIAATRAAVGILAAESQHLVYLTAAGVVPLSATTALVGHDGWADARLGDFDGSNVILNDFVLIRELRLWQGPRTLDKDALRSALAALGDEAALHFARVLAEAAAHYPHVIAVTHVPPFREAAWYQGRPSADDFLPHFSCKAVGDALLHIMPAHPHCQLLVLCGHTHGGGEIQPLPNVRVLTGAAQYGAPAIQQIFTVT